MKILCLICCLFCFGAFAEKATSYNELVDLKGSIQFNVSNGADEEQDVRYYPYAVVIYGKAKTPEGAKLPLRETVFFGTESVTKYEGKKLFNALPSWAKPMVKKLYSTAINTDISQ